MRISSPSRVMPALFTSSSTGPNVSSIGAEGLVDRLGVGDVGLHREHLGARGLDRGLGLLGALGVGRVAERDPVARRAERDGDRRGRCRATRR